jgi:glycosyltransferase involved in cell wall biosynthesis
MQRNGAIVFRVGAEEIDALPLAVALEGVSSSGASSQYPQSIDFGGRGRRLYAGPLPFHPILHMRTRLLFVTYTFAYGGTERALEDLVLRLDLSRVEPIILCFGPNFYSETLNHRHNLGIHIQDNLKANGFLSYWKAFRRHRPDVTLFVNGLLGLFPWYAYFAARLAGAKRIVGIEQVIADPHPHRDPSDGFLEPLFRLGGWHARSRLKFQLQGVLSDLTVCVSDAVRRRLIDDYAFPAKKTVKIWNGADLSYFGVPTNRSGELRASFGIAKDDPVIVCVARLDMNKGIQVLLEAVKQIVKEFPTCKCWIVGEGPARKILVQRRAELDLSEVALFVGHQADIRPYLEAADIFVLPSFKEGLPLSLVEAMAYGLPAVVTDVGGNAEVVVPGHNGFVVEPGSIEQLTDAIKRLLANGEERRKMGENGRRTAKQFDVDLLMSQLQEVLLK